jgi:hypothetical protein
LMEKYGIGTGRVYFYGGERDGEFTGEWYANCGELYDKFSARGKTPLIAICNLILVAESHFSLDTTA